MLFMASHGSAWEQLEMKLPLTDRKVKTAGPGRHGDGNGLYLLVKASGTRSWLLRFTDNSGKRRDHGLGPYPLVTLADARQRALEARRAINAGADPVAEGRRRVGVPFRAVAEELIESKRPGWRNAVHAAQWPATLEAYAYAQIGDRPVQAVNTDDMLAVLKPIWVVKTVTANRVRQRIEAVLDYATARGLRVGGNPARWRGHLDHLLPKPGSVRDVQHLTALDWREAPALMARLPADGAERATNRALMFTILTAARSGEVRNMTWGEVDLAGPVWTVPAARMKARREHRVPLVPDAIALLGERGAADALIFESQTKPGRPVSVAAVSKVLKRVGRGDLTTHGFRSTFRDWAGEATGHSREVIEHALAHRIADRAEAAYARGDLFTKRRRLMEDWAAFLARPVADVAPSASSEAETG